MKNVLESMVVAFSMYAKLPMPHIEWNEKNMKYAICYFPLIGIAEGVLMYLWFRLALFLQLGTNLRAAVLVAIPILVSGGIHMDGFLDTSDALSSWKSQEEKLEIMKDSHAGAFAIICGLVYFVLLFGVYSELKLRDMPVVGLLFVLSRAWSGLALVKLKKAKNTGLLRTFADAAANRRVALVMSGYILVVSAVMIAVGGLRGLVCAALGVVMFGVYRQMSYKKFGGITGDLAGWFVQLCELVAAMGVVIV